MNKCNFVLTVKFNNGKTSELYNLCGLNNATIEEAKMDAVRMVKKYTKTNSLYGKYFAKHWKDAKPFSMRYDLVEMIGKNETVKGRKIYTF